MPTDTPPVDPDSLAVLHALSREGLSAEDAYNAVEGIRNMAAANLIERFEAKLEAKLDAQNAKLDAQDAKFESLFGSLRWMLMAVLALLAALTALGLASWLFPKPAASSGPPVVVVQPTPTGAAPQVPPVMDQ